MKKLLTIIAILFTVNANALVIYNDVNFRYTPFVQFACEQLGIEGVDIYLSKTNKPVQAHVMKTGFGSYIIYINPNNAENYHEILAHELTHVKQDLSGVWDISMPTTRLNDWGSSYVSEAARMVEAEAHKSGRLIARAYRRK
jgi:hypothetical protein